MKAETFEYLKQMDLYIRQAENGIEQCEASITHSVRQIELADARVKLEQEQILSYHDSITMARRLIAKTVKEETEG